MHTTPMLDYAIVREGVLMLEFDGGDRRDIHAGDIVVQQERVTASETWATFQQR
ncbi:hypothetical protein [Rhizobium jaguaris]|uniref:hypothetical protein n=1 Tax=Rhizobium jaguaris TaxID=1312183 RepID=UPI0013C4879B|nr:hypothetical protein [Rhizobium jaguaris]